MQGVSGNATLAQGVHYAIPFETRDGGTYLLTVKAQGIYSAEATDNLISLMYLLKSGFMVDFQAGSQTYPSYGSMIVTPTGEVINLIFENDLWHIPRCTTQRSKVLQTKAHPTPLKFLNIMFGAHTC